KRPHQSAAGKFRDADGSLVCKLSVRAKQTVEEVAVNGDEHNVRARVDEQQGRVQAIEHHADHERDLVPLLREDAEQYKDPDGYQVDNQDGLHVAGDGTVSAQGELLDSREKQKRSESCKSCDDVKNHRSSLGSSVSGAIVPQCWSRDRSGRASV